ncbi:hypothetical protein ACWKWZ_20375 [Metapseudomonas otitidis]|jgi:hypothetical protein|uniref:Transcriptional regulator SutA RNAP-binding domain-containing protein n=1 Tax=Metapseudomonas otitidis TaxID=319939 RepID=A0A1I0U2H2_9GAMM|nr:MULTISPECIES: hypothetical protein [Pseudomonas]MDL5599114.1 hypothetical protein [Bacillus subtilis]KIV65796.1 hypothetical protein SZ55_3934 [Pseudomonas sp. FeS53a]MBO2928968.1 hypothetical protein [Pseudomonas otitidis]MCO7553217.1 hypothetical protein [Pseudomonas otitidis]MCP1619395.1 hypothetical protein [Pseudomonas otitidis]
MSTLRIRASARKAEAEVALETRATLDDQVAAFLRQGGEIQKVAKGVSGLPQNGAWSMSRTSKKK